MPKPLPKRQPRKILVVYTDATADAVKGAWAWVLDPNKLEFINDSNHFFKSGDMVGENLSTKAVMEKLAFFIKGVNVTGTSETLPELVVWDDSQMDILKQHIPNIQSLVHPRLVTLQLMCYHVFKYSLLAQNFSLNEISELMGIDGELPKRMVIIARKIEQTLKKNAKELKKGTPVTKNKDRVVKDDYINTDVVRLQQGLDKEDAIEKEPTEQQKQSTQCDSPFGDS